MYRFYHFNSCRLYNDDDYHHYDLQYSLTTPIVMITKVITSQHNFYICYWKTGKSIWWTIYYIHLIMIWKIFYFYFRKKYLGT